MRSEDLERKLSDILELQPEDERYTEATDVLERFAEALEAQLVPGEIRVMVEPGYQVQMGQQLNVVVAIEARNFRDVLFRAYVPMTGFPVSLDLYGEDAVRCDDETQLADEILQFMGQPEIKSRLGMLKRMASE